MVAITLVRGLPGSGKSTLARSMANHKCRHVEADMYFMRADEEGKITYLWEANKILEAHRWCFNEARAALHCKLDIVVSNTFVRVRDMVPYLKLGREYGATLQVVHCQGMWDNVHNVPHEKLDLMRSRWQEFDLKSWLESN